jgi:AcrR family transcriptional regulator
MTKICEETFAKLTARMQAIQADPSAPMDKLRRGLRTYIEFGLDHPNHYVLTFVQAKLNHEAVPVFQTVGLQSFACMRQCVQNCIDAGETVSNDADELAQTLWAGIHGMTSLLITCSGFPFVERTRLIDRMVHTLIEGVRRDPKQ